MIPKDLKPIDFPKLTWEPQKSGERLDKLCEYATSQAQEAIYRYFSRKKWRRQFGRSLRVISILLVAFVGMLLIINDDSGEGSKPVHDEKSVKVNPGEIEMLEFTLS